MNFESDTIPLKKDWTKVVLSVENGKTYTVTIVKAPFSTKTLESDTTRRLTPKESDAPLINCPRVFGATAGNPFFFHVAVTGALPIAISAGLPPELHLHKNGIISGITPSEDFSIRISATNAVGVDHIVLTVRVGGKLLLTPPMGWNSWYAQSDAISDKGIREITDAAVSNALHDYGWSYINIDDAWQGVRSPEPPYALQGKRNFSIDGTHYGGFMDMPALTDYVHDKGLKIGLYMSPKLQSYQGFIGATSFNESGMDYQYFSPKNGNTRSKGPKFDESGAGTGSGGNPGVYQPTQVFGCCWGGYEQSVSWKFGDVWLGDADAKQWAEWGFDYVKWDWMIAEDWDLTKKIVSKAHEAIVKSGRDIVLSLSNHCSDVELAKIVNGLGANVARTTGDITDFWNIMSANAKNSIPFLDVIEPGFWPDPDMLQVGMIGVPGGLNVDFHKTNLNENEQYFQVSMWVIFPAPLLLSCDLKQLDDFTRSLLTNREVIAVNQDSLGLAAKQISGNDIMAKKLSDGTVAVGFFNWEDSEKTLKAVFADITKATGIDLSKGANVRNLWEQKDMGLYKDEFSVSIKRHAGLLYKVTPANGIA